jgi:DNA-binding NarL/FixJ family response regulator
LTEKNEQPSGEQRLISVLLIEDVDMDAALIQGQLQAASPDAFKVRHETTLAEGIAAAGEADFDVVLMDLGLPDSQGLLSFLKLYRRVPNLPIVILTSTDDQFMAADAVHCGAQDYLVKGKTDADSVSHALRFAVQRYEHVRRIATKRSDLWFSPTDAERPGARIPAHTSLSPLRVREPAALRTLCDKYRGLIELARKNRDFGMPAGVSEHLLGLANQLFKLCAGPRDMDDIHRTALEQLSAALSAERLSLLINEERLLHIDLYRFLIDMFRGTAIGILEQPKEWPAEAVGKKAP